MDTHIKILNLIEIIRESFPKAIEVYTKGSCVQFALILNTIYPSGEIYYNMDHAVFRLNNHFYHILGEIEIDDTYIRLTEYGIPQLNKILQLKYTKNV